MQLSLISNNSTTFNGYTKRKALRFVDDYKNLHLNNAPFLSFDINRSFDKLQKALNCFMNKLHPETQLTVGGNRVKEFQIKNPISSKVLIFLQGVDEKIGTIKSNQIIVSCPLPTNPGEADNLANDLQSVKKEDVDRFFYDSAISELMQKAEKADNIFEKLKLKHHINKIIKYKEQCNIDSPETKETLLKKVNDAFSKSQKK